MTLSKQLLICAMIVIIALRWVVLGYVISKNGEPTKPSKYNPYKHVFWTLIQCWVLYELAQD